MFDLKIFSIFRFFLECFCTCSAYAMMSLIFKVLPLPTVELVEGPSSRTLRHGSLLRERGCGIIEYIQDIQMIPNVHKCPTIHCIFFSETYAPQFLRFFWTHVEHFQSMPQYAISLVVKRLARIPLWSLWSSNLMVFWWSLAVDHTWQSRLKSFLQEFLETRTSSVTNSECEVGWMMDASVKTTNRWTMTHLIYIYWNYWRILMETWICRICITCFAWNGPRMV